MRDFLFSFFFFVLHVVGVVASMKVSWGKFDPLPMTEYLAQDFGWTLISDGCHVDSTSPFVGKRYILNDDHTLILIYDIHGQIAGIQSGFKAELKKQRGRLEHFYQYDTYRGIGYYYVSAYFTEPKNVCCYCISRAEDHVGDHVLVFKSNGYNGSVDHNVPLRTKDLYGTKWVKGKCVPSMGTHYWYDVSITMQCIDSLPFFTLYNSDGHLNAFGITPYEYGGNTGLRLETASSQYMKDFFTKETLPACLQDRKFRPTMHVYFTKVGTLTHTCNSGLFYN